MRLIRCDGNNDIAKGVYLRDDKWNPRGAALTVGK